MTCNYFTRHVSILRDIYIFYVAIIGFIYYMTEQLPRDLATLKKKIVELEKVKTNLEDKIENETQKNQILLLLKSEYEKLRDNFLEEEQKNLTEIQNLSLDVKNVKKLVPDKKYVELHDTSLEEGEVHLMDEIEKMEKASSQIVAFQNKFNFADKKLKELTPLVEQLELIVLKYESISKSLTKMPNYFFNVEDLENELENLRLYNPIRRQTIAKRIEDIKNFEIDNSFKVSELRRTQATLDGAQADVSAAEANLSSLVIELQKLNLELQNSNNNADSLKDDKLTKIVAEIDEYKKMIDERKKYSDDLRKEIEDSPKTFKEAEANDERAINKKKQLVNELIRKINETKGQILRSNSMSEEVMALTAKMEEEWCTQQELSDKCAALTKELVQLKALSDRKKEILSLVNDLAAKEVRKHVGMKSLDQLYEVAAEQNRLLSRQIKMIEVEFENAQNLLASLA